MKNSLISIITILVVAACTAPTTSPTDNPTRIPTLQETSIPTEQIPQQTNTPEQTDLRDGDIAFSHMDFIANNIGARPAGTEKEAQSLRYIVSIFEKLRYPSQVQPFTVAVKGTTIQSANVIAVKQGVSSQEIIVGAHYDSVKVGNGADDNSSGVGVLLEVAERIQNLETPYSIRFILFGAEEVGLQGSKYYVTQMTEEQKKNTIAMINLDSVTAGDFAYIYGDKGEKGAIRDWALQFAKKNNLTLQTQSGENPKYPAGTTGDWSDHAPFKKAGIPYTYFESTNWMLGDQDGYTQVDPQYGENGEIWHTQYDTMEYINTTFPGRVPERLHLFVTVLKAILTEFKLQ